MVKQRDKYYLENLELRNGIQKRISVIDVRAGDPVPNNEDDRRLYVGKYADFHKTYLETKLYQLIGAVREALDTSKVADDFPLFTSRSDYDSYLRGTSNAFKLLLDFGEQMNNENADYISRAKINP